MILNDSKAKFKTEKTLIQTLIEYSPMNDDTFTGILEVYDTEEGDAMELMINCKEGKFMRDFSGGWIFETDEQD